ncbi:MAG: GNAT family N-acetyltransferase [Acidimicrobiia bacterium]
MNPQPVHDFLARLAEHDGFEPLSDAKVASLAASHLHVVIAEDETVVAVGSVASHAHIRGRHFAIEVAVEPSMRFPAFEVAALEAATTLVPAGERLSVWSQQSSTDRALAQIGYEPRRSLHYMSVVLPLPGARASLPGTTVLRSYTPRDDASLVSVNNDAFRTHREAGRLSADEMKVLTSESWFDARGLLVAETESGITGFCWTRIHSNEDGEIFRVAVPPSSQSGGLGRMLVEAGFDYLSRVGGVKRGTLWVDAHNDHAMALYESIGMRIERTNREFEPVDQPKR